MGGNGGMLVVGEGEEVKARERGSRDRVGGRRRINFDPS